MFEEHRFWSNLRRLEDKHLHVREAAALALGKSRDDRAFEPLVRCLSAKCPQAAATALGLLGDHRAFEPLLNMLTAESLPEQDAEARVGAARGLAALGDNRAVPALAKALTRLGDPKKRRYALTLQQLRANCNDLSLGLAVLYGQGEELLIDPSTLPEVIDPALADTCLEAAKKAEEQIPLLLDDTVAVRRAAAEAIGTLGGDLAVGALVRGLGDPNGEVRLACARGLRGLGHLHLTDLVQGDLMDFLRFARSDDSLAAIPLLAAARCAFDDVRNAIAALLAHYGYPLKIPGEPHPPPPARHASPELAADPA